MDEQFNLEQFKMNMKEIFKKVKEIDSRYAHKSIQGRNFNLFDLFNADHDEVSVCWILYDLLDKNGSHGQGDVYFQLFCKMVLEGLDLQEEEITHTETKVHRNYRTKGNRYIDLAIETPMRFIPIEVKLYAPDQNRQCEDYYLEAKDITKVKNEHKTDIPITYIYYLTLDGKEPSTESKGEKLNDDEIKRISFSIEIYQWLQDCLTQPCTQNADFVRINIIQFMDAIERWTYSMEKDENQDIFKAIQDNQRKSALIFGEAYFSRKNNLFSAFIETTQKMINNTTRYKCVSRADSLEFFWYKENIVDSYSISFCIYNLKNKTFMGYRLWKDKKTFVSLKETDSIKLTKKEKERIFASLPIESYWQSTRDDDYEGKKGQYGWITYEQIPQFNKDEITFYPMNDNALNLLFEDNLFKYVNDCLRPRLEQLLQIKLEKVSK